MDILDNLAQIAQRDTKDALGLAAREPEQLLTELSVEQLPPKLREITHVVVAGMGGSALAADMARDWLDLSVPYSVVKDYTLPNHVTQNTLVIVCSFSGNTEETVSALADARQRGAQTVIAAGKGKLLDIARADTLPYVIMPYDGETPRMFVLLNLKAFLEIFVAFGLLDASIRDELTAAHANLKEVSRIWGATVPFSENPAKQLAWHCAGKTPVIYAASRFRSVAYKWKIAFNETAKNVAFWDELPEFNHNEFQGWASHPVEKPFAIIDLHSSFDHPRITARFRVSDRLLSGLRPKSVEVHLEGETMLEQMLWGLLYADFVAIYLGILNGVDPAPVPLIEKFKKELANS